MSEAEGANDRGASLQRASSQWVSRGVLPGYKWSGRGSASVAPHGQDAHRKSTRHSAVGAVISALYWRRGSSTKPQIETKDDSIRDERLETTKIARHLPEAVISVAISDDSTICAAGTVAASVIIFRTEDNVQIKQIDLKSGVNAIVFCGAGETLSLVVGTFSGFVNSYYSGVPLANDEPIPADDRQFPGVMFGNAQWVHCLAGSEQPELTSALGHATALSGSPPTIPVATLSTCLACSLLSHLASHLVNLSHTCFAISLHSLAQRDPRRSWRQGWARHCLHGGVTAWEGVHAP